MWLIGLKGFCLQHDSWLAHYESLNLRLVKCSGFTLNYPDNMAILFILRRIMWPALLAVQFTILFICPFLAFLSWRSTGCWAHGTREREHWGESQAVLGNGDLWLGGIGKWGIVGGVHFSWLLGVWILSQWRSWNLCVLRGRCLRSGRAPLVEPEGPAHCMLPLHRRGSGPGWMHGLWRW